MNSRSRELIGIDHVQEVDRIIGHVKESQGQSLRWLTSESLSEPMFDWRI